MGTPGGTNGGTAKVPIDTGMPGRVPGAALRGREHRGATLRDRGVPGGLPDCPAGCPARGLPGPAEECQGDTDWYRPGRCPTSNWVDQGLTGVSRVASAFQEVTKRCPSVPGRYYGLTGAYRRGAWRVLKVPVLGGARGVPGCVWILTDGCLGDNMGYWGLLWGYRGIRGVPSGIGCCIVVSGAAGGFQRVPRCNGDCRGCCRG